MWEQILHVSFSHVSYSEYSPVGTSTLFLGTQSGKLYKIENAQSSPQAIELTGSQDFQLPAFHVWPWEVQKMYCS